MVGQKTLTNIHIIWRIRTRDRVRIQTMENPVVSFLYYVKLCDASG
jgi:hypothetical protein